MAGLPSLVSSGLNQAHSVLRRAWDDPGRIGCGLVVIALVYLMLRGCVPALAGNRLPAVLETAVTEAYEHCDQDFPIWPGEVRMPTCDLVTIRADGAGTVPAGSRANGITRALCYHVDTEKLFWGEVGQWKHEMAWALRTFSKVAVLDNGKWILYTDEENDDRARWTEFQCPGEYEASAGIVPRRS